jgi:Fic family protein
MKWHPEKPYNELASLPPKLDVETKEILKKAVTANRALAELKGIALTIPNPAMLITTLTLQEAKASSEIENILTTNDKLYEAFSAKSENHDLSTKEVLRYRDALWEGYSQLQKRPLLTTNLFIKLVQIIKENKAGIRNAPGTQIRNATAGKIIYTPPQGETVIREKLSSLEKFIHDYDRVDPLIKLALLHYQFEAIHPFFDGNGRTGRIINILFLVQNELLDLPILYLSKYIIDHKQEYYRLLNAVTAKGDWEKWILFMLDATEQTALHTTQKIIAIKNLLDSTLITARKKLPQRVYFKELIELIFHQPYCKTEHLVNAGLAKRQTAAEYLRELEKIKLLKSKKSGKEVLYLNTALLKLLSA